MAGVGRKREKGLPDSSEVHNECSPPKPKKVKPAKPLDPKKFGGMTEEEVCKLLLPDHMKPDMDIIFVRNLYHLVPIQL